MVRGGEIIAERRTNDLWLYENFGVSRCGEKYVFRTYFPNAERVELTGEISSRKKILLKKSREKGVWEAEIASETDAEGTCYKYKVYTKNECCIISDPFARYVQCGDGNSSIIYFSSYEWKNDCYMKSKRDSVSLQPINIYRLHLGTWKARNERSAHEGSVYYNYRDLAAELAEYAVNMKYTHVQLMSITENENCPFAPTSLYGRPDDLKEFIDVMHGAGIGVILEWKKPKVYMEDEIYSVVMETSVAYWIREFHFDGIYFAEDIDGGVCKAAKDVNINTLLICGLEAEEIKHGAYDICTSWEWWKNILDYAAAETEYKKYKYKMLNDFFVKTVNNSKLLPLACPFSSEEKKPPFINCFQKSDEEKFAVIRLIFSFMMLHPGKKMTFMGSEIGELDKWDHSRSVEWYLIDRELNKKLQRYVRELNEFYMSESSMSTFELIIPADEKRGIMAFRSASLKGNCMISVFNFDPHNFNKVTADDIQLNELVTLLDSDRIEFGGKGRIKAISDDQKGSNIVLPPFSCVVLKCEKNCIFFKKTID